LATVPLTPSFPYAVGLADRCCTSWFRNVSM
jgi:hypothetical protein